MNLIPWPTRVMCRQHMSAMMGQSRLSCIIATKIMTMYPVEPASRHQSMQIWRTIRRTSRFREWSQQKPPRSTCLASLSLKMWFRRRSSLWYISTPIMRMTMKVKASVWPTNCTWWTSICSWKVVCLRLVCLIHQPLCCLAMLSDWRNLMWIQGFTKW